MFNLCEAAARLEWKSFFCLSESRLRKETSAKKDWERKAEKLPK